MTAYCKILYWYIGFSLNENWRTNHSVLYEAMSFNIHIGHWFTLVSNTKDPLFIDESVLGTCLSDFIHFWKSHIKHKKLFNDLEVLTNKNGF